MFENIRDPHAARWNRLHEYTYQVKFCHNTIFHNYTLGMVCYTLRTSLYDTPLTLT